jgi:DeoR/GlpR family transcriptional regulator of sugar metabolism
MLAAERRQLILDKLQEDKKVIVSELSELFGVSEETIRRDLDKFEKQGIVNKGYGGAVLKEDNKSDMPFNIRRKKNMQGKRVIGDILEQLIRDGESIMVDPSTTAVSITKALRSKKNLTIITNSIEVLVELAGDSEWDVISTGGNLLGDYLALVGTKAIENISSYHVDKAIISCKGINMLSGITDANELFSHVKRTMLKSADQRILAVDYTKFEITAFSQICDMAEIDIVVTDMKPSGRWLTYFEEKGIKCLYGEMYESNSIRE